MVATSLSRTVEPSALARSTMFSNWLIEDSWPITVTVAAIFWPVMLGRSPMAPLATWAFWLRMAAVTSSAESL